MLHWLIFPTFSRQYYCFSCRFTFGNTNRTAPFFLVSAEARSHVLLIFVVFALCIGAQGTMICAADVWHSGTLSAEATFFSSEMSGLLGGNSASCPPLFWNDLSVEVTACCAIIICSGSFLYVMSGLNFLLGIMQSQILLISEWKHTTMNIMKMADPTRV